MTQPEPSWRDSGSTRDAYRNHRKEQLLHYEDRAVRKVLACMGIHPAELVREAKDRTGSPQLDFRLFREIIDFPIQVGVGRILYLHDLLVSELYKGFNKTALVKAFDELIEEMDGLSGEDHYKEQAFGMVFEWPKVSPFCIIHNYPASPPSLSPKEFGSEDKPRKPPEWARFLAEVRLGGKKQTVTVETIDLLMTCFRRPDGEEEYDPGD